MLQQLKLVWGINLKIKQIKIQKKKNSNNWNKNENDCFFLFRCAAAHQHINFELNSKFLSRKLNSLWQTSTQRLLTQCIYSCSSVLWHRWADGLNRQPTRQLWKVLPVQAELCCCCCCCWLTADLIFDEGLGMNQRLLSHSVWCREHPNLRYCYPSKSCPAIHRAEDRVLHSHSESFTAETNTMKSE